MKKRFFSACLSVLIALSLAICASAFSYGPGTGDDQSGSQTMSVIYNDILNRFGVEAFFAFDTNLSGSGSAEEYADVASGNLSTREDCILYAVTQDEQFVYTRGVCAKAFDAAAMQSLQNACAEYVEAEDYAMAATAFFAQVKLTLEKALAPELIETALVVSENSSTSSEESQTMQLFAADAADNVPSTEPQQEPQTLRASESGKAIPVKAILICLVIALVIALIVTLIVVRSYKPVSKKADANEYLIKGSLNVTASHEHLTHKETTTRKIENNSNGN